jgi:hypothetical protein
MIDSNNKIYIITMNKERGVFFISEKKIEQLTVK